MGSNLIKVSIALTTYNHQEYIEKCLDSILSQEVDFNYEIVIGEDQSKDKTLSIIKTYEAKYPKIIRILAREENLGYTRNFDDTMQQCKGEYIAIFDGDDYMLPGKLKKQVDFLDEHPDYVIVGHIVDAFDNNTGKIVRVIQPKKKKIYYTIEDLIIDGSFFANSSKMFRRKAYPEKGIDKRIKFIADWAVTLDIVSERKIGFIWENLALYRIHGTSIMQKLKGVDDFHDKTIIIKWMNEKYKNKYQKLFNNQWAYAYLIVGIDELMQNNKSHARNNFFTSLTYNYKYSATVYYYIVLSFAPKKIRDLFLKLNN